ncbi:hypothetical protein [Streptomyces sp. NPDC002962]|uniref:hypothetical protein n=1 Tax=Streptomyces sp. NPDC002962 TaxID=3364674 RepID=UPI0036C91E9F
MNRTDDRLLPALSILAACTAIAADVSRTAALVPVPSADASGAAVVAPAVARCRPGGSAVAGGCATERNRGVHP